MTGYRNALISVRNPVWDRNLFSASFAAGHSLQVQNAFALTWGSAETTVYGFPGAFDAPLAADRSAVTSSPSAISVRSA